MKEAMGETNMTVITIVAIGAVIAFFIGVLWPDIRDSIMNDWNQVGTKCVEYDENNQCTRYE